jgi:quinol monooxygenase YgiN
MLIRIVKMTFKEDRVTDFKKIFENNKAKIRGFEGCSFLELYRDQNTPTVFFTYSHWKDENYLNAYRNSALFEGVWAKTKILFAAKPEAWSVTKIASLK